MTQAEQSLADDKMRAEIANLIAESAKLNAETAKIARERWFYPFTVMIGALIAGVAIAKVLM